MLGTVFPIEQVPGVPVELHLPMSRMVDHCINNRCLANTEMCTLLRIMKRALNQNSASHKTTMLSQQPLGEMYAIENKGVLRVCVCRRQRRCA